MARYEHDDGNWFLVPKQLRQQCCSCGLIHVIDFHQKKDGLHMRFKRDERATAAARRSRKKNVVIVDE